MKTLNRYNNESGMALVTGLIFMAILAIMGTAAYLSSSNELLISKNHRMAREAYYASEAGLEEGRGRLRGSNSDSNWAGDPDASPDPNWSAYILTPQVAAGFSFSDDPDYDASLENYFPIPGGAQTNTSITANSLESNIRYGVKLRHKKEFHAEEAGHTVASTHYYDGDGSYATHTQASPGNIIYWGYGDPSRPEQMVQFTTSVATNHDPVEIIRTYGFGGVFASDDMSMKVIEIEVGRFPGPAIRAAIYAQGNVTGNGAALVVDGTDNCGIEPAVAPIYTLQPATTTLTSSPTILGNPPWPVNGPYSPEIALMIQQYLSAGVDIVLTSDQNGQNFGSPTNYVTVYSDTMNPFNVQGLKIQNGVGYGLLLVDGNLELGGGFNWNGLILATGTITFNGGGGPNAINILGAVMGANTATINGGVNVIYDSCEIRNAFINQAPTILSWREVYPD